MLRPIIYPFKMGSAGAILLQKELLRHVPECLRVRAFGEYKYKPNDLVINWGSGTAPGWLHEDVKILNFPQSVLISCDKVGTFRRLKNHAVPTVEWTTKREKAQQWAEEGQTVVERHELGGLDGSGIILADSGCVSFAPLYTKLVHPKQEFRVHVFKGQPFEIRKKVPSEVKEITSPYIFTYSNEYRFKRGNYGRIFPQLERESVRAIEAIGLDFGAVDILLDANETPLVLETNTAFAMEFTAVCQKMVSYILEALTN